MMIVKFSYICSISFAVAFSAIMNLKCLQVEGWHVPRSNPSQILRHRHYSQSKPFVIMSVSHENEGVNHPTERTKRKLPRSERKALERKNKMRKEKDGSGGKSSPRQQQRSKHPNYTLHSTAVSQLTSNSTAEDVFRAIKRAQKLHDHHDLRVIANFLIDDCDVGMFYGYRGSLLARLSVAALRWENHIVARKAIDIRRLEYRASMQPMESSAIIRGLLRVHNVTDALDILNDELSLPLEGSSLDSPTSKERLIHRARSLASIASRHFYEGEPYMAIMACNMLSDLGPVIRNARLTTEELDMQWLRIIQGASKCDAGVRSGSVVVKPCQEKMNVDLPCNLVYSVLSAMTTFPSNNDDHIFEAVANALVRRSLFVTGAVGMSGCPPADRGEAVFIGRSNVGKSSLVNMVTNRKSLAYISKRPGKTQQFNFFTINDKPDREKEIKYGDKIEGSRDRDSFHIVDLPGFGFAKVPEKQRQEWSSFMSEYLSTRKTVKVVFHLVDGRHGPIDEDAKIMNQIGEILPKDVAYVVVLTKADKNVKNASKRSLYGKVSKDVYRLVRETMKENKVGNAPIILTSSTTKLGRNDIWRYLRLAAEG